MKELPQDLPNDLRFGILGNEKGLKIEHKQSIVSSLSFKNKNLAVVQENRTKSTIKLSINVLHYSIS